MIKCALQKNILLSRFASSTHYWFTLSCILLCGWILSYFYRPYVKIKEGTPIIEPWVDYSPTVFFAFVANMLSSSFELVLKRIWSILMPRTFSSEWHMGVIRIKKEKTVPSLCYLVMNNLHIHNNLFYWPSTLINLQTMYRRYSD